MTNVHSAGQRNIFRLGSKICAESARSEKIEFTVWARSQVAPLAAQKSVHAVQTTARRTKAPVKPEMAGYYAALWPEIVPPLLGWRG
ncbi:hypothetical protein [Leisingera methylohalidivorans]|uniref:hypothetical protein n=1 Tax=Leisingera methylohalidivorans TaxID=133924 RepID=UPI0012EC4C7B|nr:hypothetical protein [Leisingera methylohalidivorans]